MPADWLHHIDSGYTAAGEGYIRVVHGGSEYVLFRYHSRIQVFEPMSSVELVATSPSPINYVVWFVPVEPEIVMIS